MTVFSQINDRIALLLITVVYSLSWFLILLNIDGVYWDDWTLVNQDTASVRETYNMVGSPLGGAIHVFLLSLGNQVWPYRVVTFLSYLVVCLCCYGILRKALPENKNASFFITLIIATYPVNAARVAMINTGYAYSLAAFFIAFFLALYCRGSLFLRALSLTLFFVSFFVESLLVFYAVPFALLLYVDQTHWYRGANQASVALLVKRVLTARMDFLLLPFLFFWIKSRFFSPVNLYGDYNVIHADALVDSVLTSLVGVFSLIWTPLYRWSLSSYSTGVYGFYALVFCALLIIMWKSRKPDPALFYLLIAGLVLLFLAFYPYMVVGKTPKYFDWSSRHQLLVPFGAGLTIYSSLILLFGYKYQNVLFLLIILMGILISVNDQLDYHMDAAKQESIILQLADIGEETIAPDHIILFQDNAENLNALKRRYRFYELNGFMKAAFGSRSRLGVYEKDQHQVAAWRSYAEFDHYNFGDFPAEVDSIAGKITISPGAPSPVGVQDKFRLVYLKLFHPESYADVVAGLVSLDYESFLGDSTYSLLKQ